METTIISSGLWSILSDADNQADAPNNNQQISDQELQDQLEASSLYINDDYIDQIDLSVQSSEYSYQSGVDDQIFFYPSAALFKDLNLSLPIPLSPRRRVIFTSERNLPSSNCHAPSITACTS